MTTPPNRRPARARPAPSRNMAVAALVLLIAGAMAFAALRGRGGDGSAETAGPRDQIAAGRLVYRQYCASCHGANLEGQANWRTPLPNGSMPAPPHDETGHTWHHTDQQLFEITKYGGQRFSPEGYINLMPAYEGALTDEQIWAVLAYIKSTWPEEIRAAQPKG